MTPQELARRFLDIDYPNVGEPMAYFEFIDTAKRVLAELAAEPTSKPCKLIHWRKWPDERPESEFGVFCVVAKRGEYLNQVLYDGYNFGAETQFVEFWCYESDIIATLPGAATASQPTKQAEGFDSPRNTIEKERSDSDGFDSQAPDSNICKCGHPKSRHYQDKYDTSCMAVVEDEDHYYCTCESFQPADSFRDSLDKGSREFDELPEWKKGSFKEMIERGTSPADWKPDPDAPDRVIPENLWVGELAWLEMQGRLEQLDARVKELERVVNPSFCEIFQR